MINDRLINPCTVIEALAGECPEAMPAEPVAVDQWPGLVVVLLSGGLIDSLAGTLIEGLIGGMIDMGSDVLNPVCMGLVVVAVITLDDGESVSYAGDVPCSW